AETRRLACLQRPRLWKLAVSDIQEQLVGAPGADTPVPLYCSIACGDPLQVGLSAYPYSVAPGSGRRVEQPCPSTGECVWDDSWRLGTCCCRLFACPDCCPRARVSGRT